MSKIKVNEIIEFINDRPYVNSPEEIAKRFNCTQAYIYIIAKKHKLPLLLYLSKKDKILLFMRENEGQYTRREIAEKFERTLGYISGLANKNGIELKTKPYNRANPGRKKVPIKTVELKHKMEVRTVPYKKMHANGTIDYYGDWDAIDKQLDNPGQPCESLFQ